MNISEQTGSADHYLSALPKHMLRALLPVAALGLLSASVARASTTTTGDISPGTDPSTWTSSTFPLIGVNTAGTLSVTNGSQITSGAGSIGYAAGSNGMAGIDGAGSRWNTSGATSFTVGNSGIGSLLITNGGELYSAASSSAKPWIGSGVGSHGIVTVDGANSKLSLTTTGIDIGYYGNGTLNITNGGYVHSDVYSNTQTYLGYWAESSGTVNVSGENSKLQLANAVFGVGFNGNGVLNITNGGTVVNSGLVIYIAQQAGSTGKAVVDGTGSKLTNSQNNGNLYVGLGGGATLSVSDGGAVAARNIYVSSGGLLTTDIGTGSLVNASSTVGAGRISNTGTIRMVVGANAAPGTYTPISGASTWSGAGAYQALGGIWDATAHTVTVSDAATVQAGEVATLDLSTTQRLLVTDAATGDSVGLGFKGSDASTSLSFSASPAEAAQQAALQSLLAPGVSVLSAWDFSPGEGYVSGDPVYLSLEIGSGLKLTDLAIWHFDGSLWSLFPASDLAYDDQFASFTATGFSSYAVTAPVPVPVPAAVWLLGTALAGMGVIGRRKAA